VATGLGFATFARVTRLRNVSEMTYNVSSRTLTLSPPIPVTLYTLPYWSNTPFLIFDIQALWRSGLNARAPECEKLKWCIRPVWRWTLRTAAVWNSRH